MLSSQHNHIRFCIYWSELVLESICLNFEDEIVCSSFIEWHMAEMSLYSQYGRHWTCFFVIGRLKVHTHNGMCL